jgi:hypothetical protein
MSSLSAALINPDETAVASGMSSTTPILTQMSATTEYRHLTSSASMNIWPSDGVIGNSVGMVLGTRVTAIFGSPPSTFDFQR